MPCSGPTRRLTIRLEQPVSQMAFPRKLQRLRLGSRPPPKRPLDSRTSFLPDHRIHVNRIQPTKQDIGVRHLVYRGLAEKAQIFFAPGDGLGDEQVVDLKAQALYSASIGILDNDETLPPALRQTSGLLCDAMGV